VRGANALMLISRESVVLDGRFSASGADGSSAVQMQSPSVPVAGGLGGPFAGDGGTGSPATTSSSAAGGDGQATLNGNGGLGGESAFMQAADSTEVVAASGGGGRFAADEAVQGSPLDPQNLGLVALAGLGGAPGASGPITGLSPAQGGAAGAAVFTDADPLNDFFGRAWDPVQQAVVIGELAAPIAGSGGGAGGDGIDSATFPQIPFGFQNEFKGAGGGGGGGLVMLATREFRVGPQGVLEVDGGDGGQGQIDPNSPLATISPVVIGGCGGGGSGGMLMVQATRFDLSQAGPDALSARGGAGGLASVTPVPAYRGGAGGPGLIQLHAWNSGSITLPDGVTLDELSAPNAKVLLPLALPPLP
jgi:hypothetical protein